MLSVWGYVFLIGSYAMWTSIVNQLASNFQSNCSDAASTQKPKQSGTRSIFVSPAAKMLVSYRALLIATDVTPLNSELVSHDSLVLLAKCILESSKLVTADKVRNLIWKSYALCGEL
jgi:hypothetical protein